jgi:hypothetical protein
MACNATLSGIVSVIIFSVIACSPFTARAAKVVQVCAPPGGVWGAGNTFRSKIVKFDDQTAVYMTQNVSEPDKNRWWRSPPFAWSGGEFKNYFNSQNTVAPDGDGYRVAQPKYFAHFSCVPATTP